MRVPGPSVTASNVDARGLGLFIGIVGPDRVATSAFCRDCAAEGALVFGWLDPLEVRHAPGCAVAALLAGSSALVYPIVTRQPPVLS